MNLKDTDTSYSPVSKAFHWIMALIILALLSMGFFMAQLEASPFKFEVYALHKSFGILILMLVAARIVWRLANHRPSDLPTHQKWERFLAHFTHVFLYLLIIAMPLTGWLMSSAGDFPAKFFNIFSLPHITPKSESLFAFFRESHGILAFVILGIIALHVAGAFKHHFIDRDTTLNRMTWKSLGLKGGLVLAIIAAIFILKPVSLILWGVPPEIASADVQQPAAAPVSETALTSTAPSWVINTQTSVINFDATQYAEKFSGSFKITGGQIFFDSENMNENRAAIDIDIASLSTGSADRDTQAQSAEWFNRTEFPQAHFAADRFEKLSSGKYTVYGALTLRGRTVPLSFPFTLDIKGDTARMTADLDLNRLDFGVGQGAWEKTDVIGNAVSIHLDVTAVRN